jgi:hypothetical protein
MLGKKHSKETIAKMASKIPWNKGKKMSKQAIEKNRIKHLGVKQSKETIEKRRLKLIGKKRSEEVRLIIKLNHHDVSGKNNPNWKNGLSFQVYPQSFNRCLKEKIRKRDGFKCRECYKKQTIKKLDIHHIDYDKNNNIPENLISLCRQCHAKTNYSREDWIVYFSKKKK